MICPLRQPHLLQQHICSLLHLNFAQLSLDPHRQLDILISRHQSQQVKSLENDPYLVPPQPTHVLIFVRLVHLVPVDPFLTFDVQS